MLSQIIQRKESRIPVRESLCRPWQTLMLLEETSIVWLILFYVCMTEENLDDILLRLYETHQPQDLLSGVVLAYCKEASGPCIEPKCGSMTNSDCRMCFRLLSEE